MSQGEEGGGWNYGERRGEAGAMPGMRVIITLQNCLIPRNGFLTELFDSLGRKKEEGGTEGGERGCT